MDAEAAVLVGVEEALRAEVDEGFAYGRRGHAVLLGDLLDREFLSGLETAREHFVTQRIRDLLSQGVAGDSSARGHGSAPSVRLRTP